MRFVSKLNLLRALLPPVQLLLAFLALVAALWLRPILQRLPAPALPKLELKSLNGTQHANDTCKIIHHPAGSLKYCEDLLHWKEAGVAIASCDQGRPEWNTVLGPLENPIHEANWKRAEDPNQHSHDRLYELELTGFPVDKDFHPLGLELHQLSGNTARLFLVNHRRDRSVIEVFKLGYNSPQSSSTDSRRKLSLTWERTLAHPLISTPNAIVALDSNSFLVTNDHFFNRRAHPILHVLETWLTLGGGSVVEVRFADQLPKANMDKTSDSDAGAWENVEAYGIYHQFQPIGSNQRLVFNPIGSRSLSFAPDNIHFDGPQRLIAAGHPHGLTLLKFSRNLEHGVPAGSSVAVVLHSEEPDEPLDPHQAQVHNILVDDGHYFASSTSAIIVPQSDFDDNHQSKQSSSASENKLIVTGLYQTGLLECNLSSV
ncbi:hypothetical protein PSHT_09240 [Puccinia striiformis]|uniref:Arylesterase n=1 Tax=Puccinia striiformis TaxID=27350 RepID=A0A2S4VI59_9BASI|nr:hypothetical protein PSHT_09240 [Puccinia striiformis]